MVSTMINKSQSPALPGSAYRKRPLGRAVGLVYKVDPLGLMGIVLLVGLWFVLVPVTPRSALPTPWGVVGAAIDKFWYNKTFAFYGLADTGYFSALVYTTQNVLLAVGIGGIIGILLGLITARSRILRAGFDPIILTLGTVPILIASPFLLLLLGGDRASAVATVAFYVTVILYTYAQRAADNLNPVYEAAARTFGATKSRIIRNVLIPGALPEILGGIRIGLAGAWGLEAIVELLASQRGMGRLIKSITAALDIESLFAALLILAVTAAIFDMVVAMLFSWITRWRAKTSQPAGGQR